MQAPDPRLKPNIIREGRRFGSLGGREREGGLQSRREGGRERERAGERKRRGDSHEPSNAMTRVGLSMNPWIPGIPCSWKKAEVQEKLIFGHPHLPFHVHL